MAKADLTAERLRELLNYDPETGVFTWLVRRGMARVGSIAGNITNVGYIQIYVDSRSYKAHRLAWLYVYGTWPINDIDHINGVRGDNRICNLRDVSRRGNCQNQRKPKGDTESGFIGVCRTTSKGPASRPWRATINASGKRIFLGNFATPEEAYEAYVAAKRIHHPTCSI